MAKGKQSADRDGLFKRGRVWWCWVRGRRYSTRCTDRKAAKLAKAKLERAAADPSYLAAHQTTVGDAVKGFLKQYSTRGRAPATEKFYRSKCGHVTRVLGENTKLAEVTPSAVDAYVETRLEEGASHNTVGKELTALRQVLKVAKRLGQFPFAIEAVMPIGFETKYKPRERHLSMEEFRALVRAQHKTSPKHAGMIVACVALALRKSELEALRGEDIHWDAGYASIRGTKTEQAAGTVALVEPFRSALEDIIPNGAVGVLFGQWHNMTRDLAAACYRAGIPRVTANDLRRSHSSILRQSGVATDLLAKQLRHADSRMVERVYGRVSAEDVGRLITVQIQHSAPPAELPEARNQQCPGTGSNRRHEDFQAYRSDAEAREAGSFPAACARLSRYQPALLGYVFSTVGAA